MYTNQKQICGCLGLGMSGILRGNWKGLEGGITKEHEKLFELINISLS